MCRQVDNLDPEFLSVNGTIVQDLDTILVSFSPERLQITYALTRKSAALHFLVDLQWLHCVLCRSLRSGLPCSF